MKEKTPEIIISTPNVDLGSTEWRFDIEEAKEVYRQLGLLFGEKAETVYIPTIWTEPVMEPPYIVTCGSTSPGKTYINGKVVEFNDN